MIAKILLSSLLMVSILNANAFTCSLDTPKTTETVKTIQHGKIPSTLSIFFKNDGCVYILMTGLEFPDPNVKNDDYFTHSGNILAPEQRLGRYKIILHKNDFEAFNEKDDLVLARFSQSWPMVKPVNILGRIQINSIEGKEVYDLDSLSLSVTKLISQELGHQPNLDGTHNVYSQVSFSARLRIKFRNGDDQYHRINQNVSGLY